MDFIRKKIRTPAAGYTRPADTNAYTAGDVVADSTTVATILKFPNAANGPGEAGTIRGATLVDSANVATKPDLELWLFDTTITMDQDNATFTPTDAELLTLVGVIPFPTASFKQGDLTAGAGGNSICDVQSLVLPFNTKAGDNALYGVLVVRNAYVPVSAETFTVRLKVQD